MKNTVRIINLFIAGLIVASICYLAIFNGKFPSIPWQAVVIIGIGMLGKSTEKVFELIARIKGA